MLHLFYTRIFSIYSPFHLLTWLDYSSPESAQSARLNVGKDLLRRGVDEETKSDLNIPSYFLTRALENGVRVVVVVVVGLFSSAILVNLLLAMDHLGDEY